MLDYLSTPGSTYLAGVQYDDEKLELLVEFQNGGETRFWNVPPAIWEGFRRAPSAGKYFLNAVKGRFPWENL